MRARLPIAIGLVVLAIAAVTVAAPQRASAQIPYYGTGFGYGLGYGSYGYPYGSGLGYGSYGSALGTYGYPYGYGLGYGSYGSSLGTYGYPYGSGLGYGSYGSSLGTYGYPSVYGSYASPFTYGYGSSSSYLYPSGGWYNPDLPGVNFSSVGGDATPDSCWTYDSWCSYCTANASSDLCKEMQPKPMAGGS
jgi:hypothetical protein